MSPQIAQLIASILASHRKQFWLFQAVGWVGFCIMTFFSLTLWYNQPNWSYLLEIFLQAILGLLLSLLLYRVYAMMWNRNLLLQALVDVVALLAIAAIWTVSRMAVFTWLTGETHIWKDLGGWYFASFTVFLGWSATLFCLRFYQLFDSERRRIIATEAWGHNEEQKRLEAESVARESQLKMLRYQLTPHFLFNTLNAIGALVQVQETEAAHRMIVNLSDFLRLSLDHDPTSKITVDQEVAALMVYLDIEKARFGERLQIDIDVSEKAGNALVPSLLCQPMVENSIKYAIAMNEEGGSIRVSVTEIGDQLVLCIQDTGAAVTTRQKRPMTGRKIGLHNTIDRLKTFYGEGNYSFEMKPLTPAGLSIVIKIPFEVAPEIL